jgi:predicted GIY-YIG superfamily endonuclease
MDNSIQQTTLYRYFNEHGQLLYVGITGNNYKRQSQHRRGAEWFVEATSATFEHFPNRGDALLAETQAIQTENPIYNIAQTDNYQRGSRIVISHSAKMHLVWMLSEPENGHNQIHKSWADFVKLWIQEHDCFDFDTDLHFVYHLYQVEQQYKNKEIAKYPAHELCQLCADIFTTPWYLDQKQFIIDSLQEYEDSLR